MHSECLGAVRCPFFDNSVAGIGVTGPIRWPIMDTSTHLAKEVTETRCPISLTLWWGDKGTHNAVQLGVACQRPNLNGIQRRDLRIKDLESR